MKRKLVLFSVVILFFLITCTKSKGPLPESGAVVAGVCDTGNWYNGKIEVLIKTSCASADNCHGANPGGVPYTTFAGLKYDIDNGTFKERVFTIKDMPKGGALTATELQRLQCWLDKGAPETGADAGGNTGGPCATNVSYSVTIAPLLTTNCNTSSGCHGSGSIYGDFTGYAGVSAKVTNGSMNNRVVVLKDMAQYPIVDPPLSSTQIGQIDCWIQNGGQDN